MSEFQNAPCNLRNICETLFFKPMYIYVPLFLIHTIFFFLQMADKTGSKVWDYFSKDPAGEAVCNACAASLSQGSSHQKTQPTYGNT